jgi:hypothetical protein
MGRADESHASPPQPGVRRTATRRPGGHVPHIQAHTTAGSRSPDDVAILQQLARQRRSSVLGCRGAPSDGFRPGNRRIGANCSRGRASSPPAQLIFPYFLAVVTLFVGLNRW